MREHNLLPLITHRASWYVHAAHAREEREWEGRKVHGKSENALPCYCEMNNFCFFFFFLCTNSNQPASPKQPLYYFFLDCCPLFLTCLSLSLIRVHALQQYNFALLQLLILFLCLIHIDNLFSFFYNFLSSALTAAFSPFCCHSPMLWV